MTSEMAQRFAAMAAVFEIEATMKCFTFIGRSLRASNLF